MWKHMCPIMLIQSLHKSASRKHLQDNQPLELMLLISRHVPSSKSLSDVTKQESCELLVCACPIINTRIVYSHNTTGVKIVDWSVGDIVWITPHTKIPNMEG
jgi:hypothetical protein